MYETAQLAEVLAQAKFSDLPEAVVQETRRAVLDWLGSALAGSLEIPSRMVQTFAASLGQSSEATLFPASRASAPAAALANGVSSHILEFDDVHKQSTLHAGAAVIPAALAVAERSHSSGASFLLAVAVGYEAAIRVGEAVNPSHYKFWHPTGTVGTFGSAAAAGSLVKLSVKQMVDALGTAGTQAAGLWEFNTDGAMSKHLHPGKAAFNGVLAADLALSGFTGARQILEGKQGFFHAMSQSFDGSRLTCGLGKEWKISENWYKLHSCCGHTHTAVDAVLDFRSRSKKEVESLEIHIYGPGFQTVSNLKPSTPYQAKFSIAYCAAVALLEGQAGLDQFSLDHFSEGRIASAQLARLIANTKIHVKDDLTAQYPKAWPVRVRLQFADGTADEIARDFPLGSPENPVLTAVLEEKFVSLIAPRFGSGVAEKALESVRAIHECEDVAQAFSNLM